MKTMTFEIQAALRKAYHALFWFITRVGFFGWLCIPWAVLVYPWYTVANAHDFSMPTFLTGLIPLVIFAAWATIRGLMRYPNERKSIWVSVDMKYDVLSMHMWKEMPTQAELEAAVVEAVRLAKDLKQRELHLVSPLFVRHGRLRIWGNALQRRLAAAGLNVTVQQVPPRPMWRAQALLFNLVRILRGYDPQSKHLPPINGYCRVLTAGFKIVV